MTKQKVLILHEGEGHAYVAMWLNKDICGQGASKELAMQSLYKTIAAHVLFACEDEETPFEHLKPSPQRYWNEWDKRHPTISDDGDGVR